MAPKKGNPNRPGSEGTGRTLSDSSSAQWKLPDEPAESQPGWLPLMDSRLSSKNQITLPVAVTRALDWRPGDDVTLMVHGDMVVLHRSPRTPEEWLESVAGTMTHVEEWSSKEKIDAWVRAERDSWDREWDQD